MVLDTSVKIWRVHESSESLPLLFSFRIYIKYLSFNLSIISLDYLGLEIRLHNSFVIEISTLRQNLVCTFSFSFLHMICLGDLFVA
jgi:hypothetical protein